MTQTENVLPIPEDGIAKHIKNIDAWLNELSFTPTGAKERVGNMSVEMQKLFQNYAVASTGTAGEKISILENLKRFSDGSTILSTHAAKIANTIKYGFAVGTCVMEQYEKASGLANLRTLNQSNSLSGTDVTQFQQSQMTGAAVELFVSSYYIVWELSKYQSEEVSGRVIPDIQLPEFTIINAQQAVKFSLFYFGKFIASEKMVQDDVALIKFTIEYFSAILKELDIFKSSLKHTEEFENRSYKLGKTEFVVHGFNAELSGRVQIIEFNRVSFDEIVGNRDSKHQSNRLIQTLMCYDPKEKRNPMRELGGFQDVSLGEGPPGTGKSLIIAATATALSDRCKDLGVPFLYWPFPPNPVSEYQGGSSTRVLDWFKPLKDPGKIIYGPIDDAENNLVSRGNKSISSGNREVISIFLTETEGAGAVKHGNYVVQMFTNRPEDIDSAVLSRIGGRAKIDGAVTWQDFMDQDYLWWSKLNQFGEEFANLAPSAEYVYFENQKKLKSLSQLYVVNDELLPTHEKVRSIFLELSKTFDPKKHDQFYGMFYEAVRKEFPFFTSRDVRNIQVSISGRIMDFDFPSEWMQDNAYFFAKKCDEKKKMLIACMKENMNGLSFAEMRTQEAIKYIDITVRINETKFETSVREELERMQVYSEAERRFLKK